MQTVNDIKWTKFLTTNKALLDAISFCLSPFLFLSRFFFSFGCFSILRTWKSFQKCLKFWENLILCVWFISVWVVYCSNLVTDRKVQILVSNYREKEVCPWSSLQSICLETMITCTLPSTQWYLLVSVLWIEMAISFVLLGYF